MAPKKPVKKSSYAQVPRKRKSQSKIWLAIVLIAVVIIAVGAYAAISSQAPPSPSTYPATNVLLQTTAGNITISLRTDKPITDANFVKLVQEGKYDNTTFHRVVKGFMIQGGQVQGENSLPTIQDEIGNNNHNTQYTIAMAKTNQPNSATSEFFINTVDNSNRYSSFDTTYAVFGTVTSGQDVVRAIENAATLPNPNIPGENSIPVDPVTIIHATIVP